MAAIECSSMGIKWTFTPMVDIARDPRWGRIAEGFGEDPHLASVLGVAVVYAADHYIFACHPFRFNLWQAPIMAIVISVAAQIGDLCESLLKRDAGIKDSSDYIPGHGGFLDRFDGLLISAPFIVAFLEIF